MQKTAKNKRLKNAITWAVFVPVVAFFIFLVVVKLVSPGLFVNVTGYGAFRVSNTKSMAPEYQTNDLIVIKKTCYDKLEVGDNVTFKTPLVVNGRAVDGYITHKIIEKVVCDTAGDVVGFRTSGIAEGIKADRQLMTVSGADGANKYVGRVVLKSSLAGGVLAYLQSFMGIAMLVMNGVLIWVFMIVVGRGEIVNNE